MVLIDEWIDGRLNLIFEMADVVERFENPLYPTATITIRGVGLDKNDPRHPNPAAGTRSTTSYTIHCDNERIGGKWSNLCAAKLRARAEHERRVAELREDEMNAQLEELERNGANPNFGRF